MLVIMGAFYSQDVSGGHVHIPQRSMHSLIRYCSLHISSSGAFFRYLHFISYWGPATNWGHTVLLYTYQVSLVPFTTVIRVVDPLFYLPTLRALISRSSFLPVSVLKTGQYFLFTALSWWWMAQCPESLPNTSPTAG